MAIDAISNGGSLASYQDTSTVNSIKDSVPANGNIEPVEKVDLSISESKNKTEDPFSQSSQNPEQIKKAVENLNKRINNSEVLFGIHDETNRVVIKIVDKETKEVIKELPPEKTLDMIAKAWELAGLLVDEKR